MPDEINTIADASRAVDEALGSGELASPADDIPETVTETPPEEPAAEETPPQEPEAAAADEASDEGEEEKNLVDVLGTDGQVYRVTEEERNSYITDLGVKAYYQMMQEAEAKAKGGGEDADEGGEPKEPSLEDQIKSLQERLDARDRSDQQTQLSTSLDKALGEDKFLKEHPELTELVRKSTLATIHANPRATTEQAVKAVTKDFAKTFQAERKAYVTKKAKASLGGEGGGGGATVTPAPKKMTADDLLKGRIGNAALNLFKESG